MSGSVASLSIDRIVNVQVDLAPPAPQAENVDTCLVLGTGTEINVVERMREYGSLTGVALDYPTGSLEYQAAAAWFDQAPQPTTLLIGRWVKTASSATLIGATLSVAEQLITNFTAVTSPGFYVVIDGTPYNIAPASLAATTNLNGVATIIQTALAAAVAGSTCVWNGIYDYFVIVAGGTAGPTSTLSFLAPPTGLGSATMATNVANNDTLTIAGTVVTFVTSGATGNEVNIGGSNLLTLAALLTFLNASTDSNLVKCTYIVVGDVLYITAAAPGSAGDALTLAKSSTAIVVSGATLTGGATTDISGLMQMNATDSGVIAAQGIAAESLLTAVTLFDNLFANLWYGLCTPSAADADTLAVAAYIEGDVTKHYYGVTTQEAGVLNSGDTSDIAFLLKQGAYNHTGTQFSSSSPVAIMSYLARILTTDWAANNSTITLKFKQEPGIVAETLNLNQATAVEAKNCNVFVAYNDNTAIVEQGVSCSGQFTDTIIGLDWFALELQNNLYTELFESPTKIPETDAGNHVLAVVIADTCNEAVNNGLFGPGTWLQAGFGSLQQNQYLPNGYYIFQPTVASLTASEIGARISVPFQIAVNLAGAIHSVNATVLVNS
jgi:hypothetical protein